MEKKWETISVGEEMDFNIFKARFEKVKNPKTGATLHITKLTGNDSVNVLAITPEGQALLLDQYRFGIENYVTDLPGGIVDDGEDHQQAAKRELMEETGYSATEWIYAGCVASNPVFMDSYIHHYLALGAVESGEVEHEDGEDIEMKLVDIDMLEKMLADGEFMHPHTVSGIVRGLEMKRRQQGFPKGG